MGAVLIVCGLYMVLWGKSKEMKKIAQLATSKIAQEAEEDIEVVVMSTPIVQDHDKLHVSNNNHIQVDKEHDSKNGDDPK